MREGSGGGWQSGTTAGLAAIVARERRERDTGRAVGGPSRGGPSHGPGPLAGNGVCRGSIPSTLRS